MKVNVIAMKIKVMVMKIKVNVMAMKLFLDVVCLDRFHHHHHHHHHYSKTTTKMSLLHLPFNFNTRTSNDTVWEHI